MRQTKRFRGRLCKECIHNYFWKYTSITLLVGWCGWISLFIAPFFVVHNLVRYLICLPMPGVPEGAELPELSDQATARIWPHADELLYRLNRGQEVDAVAVEFAEKIGVTASRLLPRSCAQPFDDLNRKSYDRSRMWSYE